MKKRVFCLVVLLTASAAFGQGKVLFANDSLHLVYWDPEPIFGPPGLAGQALDAANVPGGYTPVVDLYLGTASQTLTLTMTTTFTPGSPGRWNSAQVAVPGIPGGTTAVAAIQVRNAAEAPPTLWSPNGYPFATYFGESVEFSFTLGSGPTYPDFTGWPPGNYPLPPYGSGAIRVGLVPEPSSFVLLGLGSAAAFLFYRRLKSCRRPARVTHHSVHAAVLP
jgi:hypothetical protein